MAAPVAAAAAAGSTGAPEELEAPVAAVAPAATAAAAGPSRPARLPLSRVKALVKADPDVSLASQEAVFVLARAAVSGRGGGPRANQEPDCLREGRGFARSLFFSPARAARGRS